MIHVMVAFVDSPPGLAIHMMLVNSMMRHLFWTRVVVQDLHFFVEVQVAEVASVRESPVSFRQKRSLKVVMIESLVK
jgi:hypothetical protein